MKQFLEKLYVWYLRHQVWSLRQALDQPKIAFVFISTLLVWYMLPFIFAGWALNIAGNFSDTILGIIENFKSALPPVINITFHLPLFIFLIKWWSIAFALNSGKIEKAQARLSKVEAKLKALTNA
ncbi:MAG: hypothetical protein GQ535_10720 [Rhodobacteraceae bacterium]|nr:hypothetical protein [Paracoccaceae bacterium]